MRILFIAESVTLEQEPLGIMHLSAMLKAHQHECRLISLDQTPGLVRQVKDFGPQLLAFSATTGIHKRYVEASREIKKDWPALAVFGGPHASFFPQLIEEDGVDVICRGEGEYPLLELVEALANGRDFSDVPNLWIKSGGQIRRNATRGFLEDLDSLPFPDRSLVRDFPHLTTSGTRFFMAGRGCPYDCSFCFNHVARDLSNGPYVRWRSVDNLIEEIGTVRRTCDLRLVSFQDDTFILRRDWLREFAEKYKRQVGLPFFCHVRANLVDEEMSLLLADAGCVHVGIGLESGSDDLRNRILRKNISKDQIINSCRSLRSQGILITTQNMFGVPHETVDTVSETIELNIQCKPHRTNLYFFMPYPGTDLAAYAIDQGYFSSSQMNSLAYSFSTEFAHLVLDLPQKADIEDLARLTRFCVRFPIFFPAIRWLFRLHGKRQVKSLATRSLLTMQAGWVALRSAWQRLVRKQRGSTLG